MRGRQMSRQMAIAMLAAVWCGLFSPGCEPASLDGLPPPGPSAVEVTVSTRPAGATVVIDGTPLGAGPITVKLNPGPHRLKAAKSGYFAADQKLIVSSGDEKKSIELTLVSSH